jgi:hypothetical protein
VEPCRCQSIANVRDDAFVVYRSNALPDCLQFAVCYNAALPSTWSELFGGIRSEHDVRVRLRQWWSRWSQYDGQPGSDGWFADQTILFEQVMEWRTFRGSDRIVLLDDEVTGFKRLDRLLGEKVLARLPGRFRRDICAGRYSDYHLLRPPDQYAEINEGIISLAIAGQRAHGVIISMLSHFRRAWF